MVYGLQLVFVVLFKWFLSVFQRGFESLVNVLVLFKVVFLLGVLQSLSFLGCLMWSLAIFVSQHFYHGAINIYLNELL